MTGTPEPVEGIDYVTIKRVRYELHVEGVCFVTADEACNDFDIDPAKIDLSEPMIADMIIVGSEERRIDDPSKPFDREAWMRCASPLRPWDKERPKNETTLEAFAEVEA